MSEHSGPADLPELPELPRALTFERLQALLQPQGYAADADGSALRKRFSHAEIAVSLPAGDGSVLLVGAVRTGTPIRHERQADLEAFVNDWHRERIWPTLVLGAVEAGLTLHAHVGVDTTAGLTDAQLGEYVRIGVGTTAQCFGTLDLPE